jgi:hypothetical protein
VRLLLAALGVSVAGCEFAVSDTLPSYTCVPGEGDVCPLGLVCDPARRICARPSVSGQLTDASVPGEDATARDDGNVADAGREAQTETNEDGSAGDSDAGADVRTVGPDTGAPDSGFCNTLGCKCSGAADCANGICAQQAAVTTPLYAAAGNSNFCSQPCCTSSDCPASGVCFASGAGGNYCVMPGWLQRTATLGRGIGGAACQSNGDCRSGVCAGSMCADTCCSAAGSSSECATGTACRPGTFPGAGFDVHAAAICGAAITCGNGPQCNRPCRNTADCSAGQACYYLPAILSKDIVAACTTADGAGAEGSRCTSDFQCASNFCDPTTMQCSDVCFANTDCTFDAWHCRPALISLATGGTDTVLTCGP